MIKVNDLKTNWKINVDEHLNDFIWLMNDPLNEKGKMTREIGILKQGSTLIRLKRINDADGDFLGMYKLDGTRWIGKVSISYRDIPEFNYLRGV